MSRHPLIGGLIALIAITLAWGCGVHFQPGPSYPQMSSADLPDDPLALLSVAHSAYSPYGPAPSVRLSLTAAEKVLDRHPQHELASFYSSRALTWLLEFGEELSPDEAKELAGRGYERARTIVELNGDRVDYVFLAGALLGNYIRHSSVQGAVEIRRVHDYFRRAVDLDPSYDGGAPLRALGTFLVKAPPWPAGVGDVDEGIEILEEAVRLFPGHPANYLYAAEALDAEGRREEATGKYERVIELCKDPRWGAVCETYLSRAKTALSNRLW
jgi:tetratricopeptide (TPR) repeat protein